MYINGEDITLENPNNLPPRICDAILAIDSSAKFTILNDDVDRIEWLEIFPLFLEMILLQNIMN